MPFRTEPAHSHGRASKTGVLVVNLGSPDAPTATATRRYLAEFLSDPRVVEIPRWIWMLVLNGIILNIRPAKSAAKYASIWLPEGSPLVVHTGRLTTRLESALQSQGPPLVVRHGMRYGNPSLGSALDSLRNEGCTRILVLPLYPQYAAATTGSVWDEVARWVGASRQVPEFRFINRYGDEPALIEALAQRVRAHWAEHGRASTLVMSFHGLPERSLHLGDPYHCECHKMARLLARALALGDGQWHITFQSRFGKAQWLRPYTEPTLRELAEGGTREVDVICPGFAVDCLETLEEIAQEARDSFLAAGGQRFSYIPCLNEDPQGVDALAEVVRKHVQGWPMDDDAAASTELRLQRQRALALGAKD